MARRSGRRITASWIGAPDPAASRGTLAAVAAPGPAPRPPGRALLRLAGVLTQLTCGVCLLIGTIGLVLVQQTRAPYSVEVAGWLAAAMAGLVFGGLAYRGGPVSLAAAALIDAGFGVALVVMEYATLRGLLRILPASDVDVIADVLNAAGFVMLAGSVLCLAAVPQGRRFARWFREAAATRTAMSTARGFPPPPVPAYGTVLIIPADIAAGSRRRLYMVLGGLAIGVGAGVGVLVSSTTRGTGAASVSGGRAGSAGAGSAGAATAGKKDPAGKAGTAGAGRTGVAANSAGSAALSTGSAAGSPTTPAPPVAAPPSTGIATIEALLEATHVALSHPEPQTLAPLLVPAAFAIGIDADEVADGRDAVIAQIIADLGEMPDTGFAIAAKALAIGQDQHHAWIAEDIQVGAAGRPPRTYAVSALAAQLATGWQIIAMHWAIPVDDATAERAAILNTLPTPHPIADAGPGELRTAVRAAFASRAAFTAARSERADAFNYGSGGERARGPAVAKIFGRLRAALRLHDGARVAEVAPGIGWAAVNVDFTSKTRAATDVTQTFRVLAVLLKEGADWKIVQTQFSNGGPVR